MLVALYSGVLLIFLWLLHSYQQNYVIAHSICNHSKYYRGPTLKFHFGSYLLNLYDCSAFFYVIVESNVIDFLKDGSSIGKYLDLHDIKHRSYETKYVVDYVNM
jgi:hypothetical protein